MALLNTNTENSEYTHLESDTKNCYMNFGGHFNENCHYNLHAIRCQDCIDNYWMNQCSHCYECFKCARCMNVFHSQWCFDCNDSWLCYDCKSCANCFGCTGLRHKEYHIFNEPCSKEEYRKRVAGFLADPRSFAEAKKRYEALRLKMPHRALVRDNCENSLGDFLENCKNCFQCFELENAEDCRYCEVGLELKDCQDVTRIGFDCELCYESMAGTFLNRVLFSNFSFDHHSDSLYIDNCFSTKNCFGCTNLHHRQYCILNKQYIKAEYEKLVPKIIEHMGKTGEWGEFFPVSLSAFGYNETVAQEYFPLSRDQALQKGFHWHQDRPSPLQVEKTIPAGQLPYDIKDIPDDILNWAILCEVTGKPFKLIPQELQFYRQHQLPVPRRHPDVRHAQRINLRNPRRLFARICAKCSAPIQTTYVPQSPETVYCEACYLKEVY